VVSARIAHEFSGRRGRADAEYFLALLEQTGICVVAGAAHFRATILPPALPPKRLDPFPLGLGIHAALGADPLVPGKDLLPEVAHIRAETPLVDTPFRTEGAPALRHLQCTPAADIASVGALRKSGGVHPTALHGTRRSHRVNVADSRSAAF
jgi:hypothetical protein